MIIAIIILSLLVVILGYTTFNLLRKNEIGESVIISYNEYMNKFSRIIEFSNEKLKQLDVKGSFKSDDEIGFFFNSIKDLQDLLNQFKIKNE